MSKLDACEHRVVPRGEGQHPFGRGPWAGGAPVGLVEGRQALHGPQAGNGQLQQHQACTAGL